MDVRVRRAMSMAINRAAIAERVMEKLAVPAANIVSPGVFGHNPLLKPDAYNPDGAKKLLAEAGYPNGFTVTLSGPNNRYINDEQVLQAVAQMLTRIGILTKARSAAAECVSRQSAQGRNQFRPVRQGLVRRRPRTAFAAGNPQCRARVGCVELGALDQPETRPVDRPVPRAGGFESA